MSTILSNVNMESPKVDTFAGGSVCYFSHKLRDSDRINGDSIAMIPLKSNQGVLVLADGAGGTPGGNKASGQAVEIIASVVSSSSNQKKIRERIVDGFEQCNKALLDQQTGAATTIFALEVENNLVRPFHVGDSLIMVVGQKGKIHFKTLQHSPLGYAREAGIVENQEEIPEEDLSVVSNLVGCHDMRIELGATFSLNPNDTTILCSDGLSDNLSVKEIADIIRTGELEAVGQALVELANERMLMGVTDNSKPDDISFIVFRAS